jgi:hypothetical protein
MLDAEKRPTGRDRSRNAEDLFIKENLPSERNSLLYEFETDDPSTRQKNLPSQDLESDHTSLLRQQRLSRSLLSSFLTPPKARVARSKIGSEKADRRVTLQRLTARLVASGNSARSYERELRSLLRDSDYIREEVRRDFRPIFLFNTQFGMGLSLEACLLGDIVVRAEGALS